MAQDRPRRALVVTGITREADCLGACHGVETLCSGADASLLRRALQERMGERYAAVLSFGLAGGLSLKVRPGDAILGAQVVSEGGALAADAALTDALERTLRDAGVALDQGAVAGVDHPAMTAASKAELRRATGAIAVDMESHLACAFAKAQGAPFAILRVVCDPAQRALPPLAAKALKPDGGVDLPLVLGALMREPQQLAALMRAGVDSGAAFATLRRCGRLLGPRLGPLLGLMLA